VTEITVVGAGGEYMESVVVVEWHKKPGDAIKAGDLVVTVETAKAATEIEAPVSGILSDIRAQVGQEIAVGAVLGIISEAGAANVASDPVASSAPVAATPPTDPEPPTPLLRAGRIVASPLARRVAAQRGVDLATVSPTSLSGRIRVRDVEAIAAHPASVPVGAPVSRGNESAPARLNVQSSGNPAGEKIVFLHGFGGDSFSWQPVLAAIGGGYHVLLVDLPGHGRSPRGTGGQGVHDMADAVAATLADLGIDAFHLVGHSLGGAVGLALVTRGRADIRSVTLLAPAGLGPEIDGSFISGFARATQPASLAPWLGRLFADESLASPAFVAATMQARADAGLREVQARIAETVFPDGTQAADLRNALKAAVMPVRILWGEQDRIIPKRHALHAAGSPALHFLANIGHMPQIEAPQLVARLIKQTMRSAG